MNTKELPTLDVEYLLHETFQDCCDSVIDVSVKDLHRTDGALPKIRVITSDFPTDAEIRGMKEILQRHDIGVVRLKIMTLLDEHDENRRGTEKDWSEKVRNVLKSEGIAVGRISLKPNLLSRIARHLGVDVRRWNLHVTIEDDGNHLDALEVSIREDIANDPDYDQLSQVVFHEPSLWARKPSPSQIPLGKVAQ